MFRQSEEPRKLLWPRDQEDGSVCACSSEEELIADPSDQPPTASCSGRSPALVSLVGMLVSVAVLLHVTIAPGAEHSKTLGGKARSREAIIEAAGMMTVSQSAHTFEIVDFVAVPPPAAPVPPPPAAPVSPPVAAVAQPGGVCSAEGANCQTTHCCSRAGFQCFEKHQTWASCSTTCAMLKSVDATHEPWTCKVLGGAAAVAPAPPAAPGLPPPAAPGLPAPAVPVPPPAAPVPPPAAAVPPPAPPGAAGAGPCSWEGDNCQATHCCRREGFQCWQKHQTWASCSKTCELLKAVDTSHEPWTCKVLGGSQGARLINAAPPAVPKAGTNLFCFMVVVPGGVTPPGVTPGYEQALVDSMRTQNIGIFACDANAVFTGTAAGVGEWKSIVNTDVFINIWNQVKGNAQYLQHDWTVKVDADAVFFPDRLRTHIQGLQPPADTAIYLHNIQFKWNFMGALEVLSKKAVETFVNGIAECSKHLGHNGGEDFFTMSCLDSLSVGHMKDVNLLTDKYASNQFLNLYQVDACVRQDVVALHPYKSVNAWDVCHKVSAGVTPIGNVVNCDDRWHGEACSMTSVKRHVPGVSPDGGNGIL